MPIHVDLNTRVLPRNHQVFFARPGKRYRLYPDVADAETILVDLPFLELEDGVSIHEQPDLLRRIRRSRALRDWHRAKRAYEEPSRNLLDYSDEVGDRGVSQLRAALVGYFARAQQGDLVLSVPGAYSQDALIGEVLAEPPGYVSIPVPRFYEGDPLTGRRVSWIAQVQKRLLTSDILNIVEKPNVFVQLPNSVKAGIYDRAYTSYATYDLFSARFDVESDTFRSYDDLLLQAFFNFVAANTRAVSEGREDGVLGFHQAAFVDAAEYAPNLRTNINSPGFLTLASSYTTPLVISVLLSLAVTVGPDAAVAAQQGTIVIGNSAAPPGDPCTAAVAEQAIQQLRLLGLTDWPEACNKAREAAANTRLRAPVRIQR